MQKTQLLHIASYVLDWALIFAAVFAFQRLGKIDGHRQRFSLTDISIQYSYTGPSTVPNFALVILSVVFPALLILVWTTLLESNNHGVAIPRCIRLWNLHSSWLGLALSICLSQVITNLFKVTVGRPRPDLISRCLPSSGSIDASPYGLSSSVICTQTNTAILQDGFRSFPSGHSSMSFSGLAYLALFLASRLQLFDNRGETWKWLLVMTPAFTASLVAITRIMDHRHHPFDVFFGSAIGIFTSFIAFYQFFPGFDGQNVYPSRLNRTAPSTHPTDGNDGTESGENARLRSPSAVSDHTRQRDFELQQVTRSTINTY